MVHLQILPPLFLLGRMLSRTYDCYASSWLICYHSKPSQLPPSPSVLRIAKSHKQEMPGRLPPSELNKSLCYVYKGPPWEGLLADPCPYCISCDSLKGSQRQIPLHQAKKKKSYKQFFKKHIPTQK